MTAQTIHGNRCKHCGTTTKYYTSRDCVQCNKTKAKRKRKAIKLGNWRRRAWENGESW